MTINQLEPLMNMKQLAAYLNINYQTAWRYSKAGKIPAFRVGGGWRVSKVKLDQWIKDKESK